MTQKVPPGPVGTSCLTCKRRHKKCDQRRPVCERCEKGKYECLGYVHNRRGLVRPVLGNERRANNFSRHQVEPAIRSEWYRRDDSSEGSPSTQGYSEATNALASSSSDSSVSPQLGPNERISSISGYKDNSIDRNSTILGIRDDRSLFATNSVAKRATSPLPSQPQLFALYHRIPHSPPGQSNAFLNSPSFNDYVLSHCDRMMEYSYFKPIKNQMVQVRHLILSRLNASTFTRWIMFLCARVCESFVKGDTSQNQIYSQWIEDVEHALRSVLTRDLESHEAQDRLCDWLEIILLRTMLVHTSRTYMVLKNATPAFLQLAFSDPTLWPANYDLTSIPLTSALASPRHELAYFALLDSVCAMAFGLPQQVEYDTSLERLPPNSNPHEWLHSSPAEFQIALAEINACRDKSSTARNWREIEHSLLTWQPRSGKPDPSWESWMAVAWLAVQESWRHTLLAYLYMAVCNVASDDPRVQSSVRQIFRVIGTVKKQESSDANVPFFIQHLIAGICARSEKHRKSAREQLANVSETRLWLMRSVDFVPVLDHLWHGAAVNGRPIKWSDYMRSREIMLPVVM